MFSDAMSSISSRWRPSSRRTASAISGSLSASDAEKKRLASLTGTGAGLVITFKPVFGPLSDPVELHFIWQISGVTEPPLLCPKRPAEGVPNDDEAAIAYRLASAKRPAVSRDATLGTFA